MRGQGFTFDSPRRGKGLALSRGVWRGKVQALQFEIEVYKLISAIIANKLIFRGETVTGAPCVVWVGSCLLAACIRFAYACSSDTYAVVFVS